MTNLATPMFCLASTACALPFERACRPVVWTPPLALTFLALTSLVRAALATTCLALASLVFASLALSVPAPSLLAGVLAVPSWMMGSGLVLGFGFWAHGRGGMPNPWSAAHSPRLQAWN